MKKYFMSIILAVVLLLAVSFNAQSQTSGGRILFVGDSITQGKLTATLSLTDAQKFSTIIGQAKGYSTIINAGKDGDTVAGLRNRLQADVLSQMPLDMVVIMIGRNDVANSASPVIPVATYKATLTEIVQTLKNAGVPKILLLSWNVGNHQFYAGVNTPPFLDAMAQVAAENDVYFIDVYSMWASYKWAAATTVAAYDALYYDNIHPNASGQLAIANFVLSPQFNYIFDEAASATVTPNPQQTPAACEPIDLPAACGDALEQMMRNGQ